MTRTTIAKVGDILPGSTNLKPNQIQAAIDGATCLVDQVAEIAGSQLNEGCLVQVETYLAAHFASVTENTLSLHSEKSGCTGSSAVYGFVFGEGVKGTPFGQMANMLSSGRLTEFDKSPVNFLSIGSA